MQIIMRRIISCSQEPLLHVLLGNDRRESVNISPEVFISHPFVSKVINVTLWGANLLWDQNTAFLLNCIHSRGFIVSDSIVGVQYTARICSLKFVTVYQIVTRAEVLLESICMKDESRLESMVTSFIFEHFLSKPKHISFTVFAYCNILSILLCINMYQFTFLFALFWWFLHSYMLLYLCLFLQLFFHWSIVTGCLLTTLLTLEFAFIIIFFGEMIAKFKRTEVTFLHVVLWFYQCSFILI